MKTYDKAIRKNQKILDENAELSFELAKVRGDRDRLLVVLDGIMHEIRRLNSEMSSRCEDISKAIDAKNYSSAKLGSDEAFYISGLISSRLTFADFEINPESVSRQSRYSAGVYKKFDKAARVLAKAARNKGVRIKFNGASLNKIEVPGAFDMVPFVLLENAVKYSPRDQEVIVTISDNPVPGVRVSVSISSIGPIVGGGEIATIKNRGVRGAAVSSGRIQGQGIGLYLADTLTRMVGGSIEVSPGSIPLYSLNGVEYSTFEVILKFR